MSTITQTGTATVGTLTVGDEFQTIEQQIDQTAISTISISQVGSTT